MAKSSLILSLAKVIIAAAWADGEFTNEELNSLKDLLFHIPEMTGREWAMLEMYMDAPVGPDERARLIAELQDELRSSADKQLAMQALEDMISADSELDPNEKVVAQEITEAIQGSDAGLVGMFGRILKGPVGRRSEAAQDAPNREKYFEDFIKNRVYYGVKVRTETGEGAVQVPEKQLRKLSLAAGLMARVAHVDEAVDESEKVYIALTLQNNWQLDLDTANFVTEVALSEISPEMDYYRLTRSFFESTSEKERVQFLDVLFAVADADEFVSSAEIEEIRALSLGLKMPHKTFIDAKLKIPRERRAN